MAINNGTADFNLSAVQSATNAKRIKISFIAKNGATGANPIVLTVYTPHMNVFTKTYTNLAAGQTETLYVDVKNFGEFRTKVSTDRGYSYDYVTTNVKISGTVSSNIYTFTDADVAKDAAGNFVITLAMTAITGGFAASASLVGAITSGVLCATFGATGIYFSKTDSRISSKLPIAGWKIKHEFSQSGYYITHKLRVWDAGGSELTPESYTLKVDTF